MDSGTVETALRDRVDRLEERLEDRWSSVPHRTRVRQGDHDPPDRPSEMPTWAAVCLVADGEELLYLRDESHDHVTWEPPGGKSDRGEAPRDTAARETVEETGVECEVTDLLLVETLEWDYGDDARYPLLQAVFAGEKVDGRAVPREPAVDDVGWFPPDDLPESTQYESLAGSRWPDR